MLTLGTMFSAVGVPPASAASQIAINNAIDKGLAYLNTTQLSDGRWQDNGFPVASTAMAVLAFENSPGPGHLPDNLADPYHTTVARGLDWLLSVATVTPLSVQPAGNPDSNGNGIGIYLGTYQPYETPMVLMAIVASQNQARIATTGPVGVIGRNYKDIATDIVDFLAFAQEDNTTGIFEGGWRYFANFGSSDNSVTGWPILGLRAAELWGINAPAFVKPELQKWLTASQILTGDYISNYFYGSFDYVPGAGFNSMVESATGVLGLSYCGVQTSDPRVLAVEGYMVRDWNTMSGWRQNFGDLYAMYGVMKAMRETQPSPTQFIRNYTGFPTIEWYNGTNQYADYLVNGQYLDGHWYGPNNPDSAGGFNLDTAWATLILEFVPVKVNYKLTVTVLDAVTGDPIIGAAVLAEGPETRSGNTGGDGKILFDAIQAGNYQVSATASGHLPSGPQTVSVISDTEITIRLLPSIDQVIPEVPIGPIAASASMIIALLGFLALPRLRKKIH